MLRTILLVASVSVLVGACSPEESGDREASGEANDDLVGRRLIIDARGPLFVPGGSGIEVKPSIEELADGALKITTDDLRVEDASQKVAVTIDNEPGQADQYGIRVEMKRPGEDRWIEMRPWYEDSAWLWTSVTFSYSDGNVNLSGSSVRYTDSYDGLTYEAKEMASATLDYSAERPEIRYLAVPAWNFWEWDNDGYGVQVNFNKTTCSYNGDEYPARTLVGPYECRDGRWQQGE